MLLADLTTLRVGGAASRYVEVATDVELVGAVASADEAGEPLLLIAGGSNVLVSDEGFGGVVVGIATRGVHVESQDACSGVEVRVAAGEPWDALVDRAVASGWSGIEALSGIPGSSGATPIQNVGAYGQEVAQTVARVRAWDRVERRARTLAAGDCGFGYRWSRFKDERDRWVVLDVAFQLPQGDLSAPVAYGELAGALGVEVGERAPLSQVRAAVLRLRAAKGMVLDGADHDTWSAGSFFTNPVVPDAGMLPDGAPRWPMPDGSNKTSAAWLIQHAGFGRGYGMPGPAALSTKHTLALTNRGDARAQDLVRLAREVRDVVRQRFGITLEPEPVLVGLTL